MLTITNPSTGVAFASVTQTVDGSAGGAFVSFTALVTESDSSLPLGRIDASIDWDDGNVAEEFAAGYRTLTVEATRKLKPGQYVIKLRAVNHRSPSADSVSLNFYVTVTSGLAQETPPFYVFGPILPRDIGSPGPLTWNFDLASDILVLASSVKMLLLTAVGERIMLPAYGTHVRQYVFNINDSSVSSLIQEDVARALARWEPRVSILSLDVLRDPNDREVSVNLALESRYTHQPFEANVKYVR